MKNIMRYKNEALIALLLVAGYFLTRLPGLTHLPIFTDEAIYIRWGQIAANDANWRFISLTDGKQPLFIWVMMPLLKIFSDPLFAGRLVSVFAGLGTMVGLFFLTYELFKNRKMGLIASLLYLIYPMALVYDRMALYDSMVGMFAVWCLYASVLLVRKIRLDVSLILGMVLGAGVLTKTNAFFSIYLLPFTLLLFPWKNKHSNSLLIRWVGFAVLSVVMAYGFYTILRLSPFFHIIKEKDAVFVYPVSEWIHHPFTYFLGNLRALIEWFLVYFTVPFLFLAGAAFALKQDYWQEKLLLVIYFAAPFVALALFGRVIYPRYILFMTLSLLPLVAYAIVILQKIVRPKYAYSLLMGALAVLLVYTDVMILTNLAKSPIPSSDKIQYISDWPAGGGVKESVAFFREQSASKKIYIGTEGTFGLMPYALELYFRNNPNVTIKGFWPINDAPPDEALTASKTMPTYFVFYQPCPGCKTTGTAPVAWPVKQVLSVKKPGSTAAYTVYEITSSQNR